MEYGAEKAGVLIEYVTEKGKEKLVQSEEDVPVSSTMKTTIGAAKTVTNASVKVSGYVADRVGNLTKSLAGYLASKVDKPISGSVSSVTGGDKAKGKSMSYLVDAARGGLLAYGTVYNGLEASSKVLGKHVKDNSVKVVKHKYGTEAGDVFGDAVTSAGNAAWTYMNIQSLGAKGLVKKTAKETGKSIGKNVLKAHGDSS